MPKGRPIGSESKTYYGEERVRLPDGQRVYDLPRLQQIIYLREVEHWTYDSISKLFEISRERVRQILKKHAVDLTGVKSATIKKRNRRPDIEVTCSVCGKKRKVTPYGPRPKTCGSACGGILRARWMHEAENIIEMRKTMIWAEIGAHYDADFQGIHRAVKRWMVEHNKMKEYYWVFPGIHGSARPEELFPELTKGEDHGNQ